MDLILWRHAEAVDTAPGDDDLQRMLTPRGEKQAARVAAWLDRHLPDGTRILCSPALRCEQTATRLGRKFKLREELGPERTLADLMAAIQWPDGRSPLLLVGHQPVLGELVAQLLGLQHPACPIRKGAAWWLRTRERDGSQQTVVAAVMSPEWAC